jgi:general stress protein 26
MKPYNKLRGIYFSASTQTKIVMQENQNNIQDLNQRESIEKMKELVDHNAVCLFTTNLTEAPFHTRPMSTQQVDDQGNFWFFSGEESNKNLEIKEDARVQLFFSNPGKSEFMTVHGYASIFKDRHKVEEIWSPIVKAWFKEGKNDPDLSLIKVAPEQAYYWDTKNNKMVSLIKILASMVTGRTMDDGVEGQMNTKVL